MKLQFDMEKKFQWNESKVWEIMRRVYTATAGFHATNMHEIMDNFKDEYSRKEERESADKKYPEGILSFYDNYGFPVWFSDGDMISGKKLDYQAWVHKGMELCRTMGYKIAKVKDLSGNVFTIGDTVTHVDGSYDCKIESFCLSGTDPELIWFHYEPGNDHVRDLKNFRPKKPVIKTEDGAKFRIVKTHRGTSEYQRNILYAELETIANPQDFRSCATVEFFLKMYRDQPHIIENYMDAVLEYISFNDTIRKEWFAEPRFTKKQIWQSAFRDGDDLLTIQKSKLGL